MSSMLGPVRKHKEPKNPRFTDAEILAGAAATAAGAGADRTSGQGGRGGGGGHGGGGGQGGKIGRGKWPDTGQIANDNTDERPHGRRKGVKICAFCVAKQRSNTEHLIRFCPWLSSTSKSDLLTTLPNLYLGCLQPKEGAHKCPDNLKEGGNLKYF